MGIVPETTGATSMKAIEYNRVATLAEYAQECTSQAAPQATVHVLLHGADSTLCGAHYARATTRMKPRRIVTCTKCQDALRSARQQRHDEPNVLSKATKLRNIAKAANTARRQQLIRDGEAMRKLRECCGFVENGSEQTVKIFQDDATRSWIVVCGDVHMISTMPVTYSKVRSYHGSSLNEAIDTAYRVEKQEH